MNESETAMQIEKTRINLYNAIGFAAVIGTNAFFLGGVYVKMQNNDTENAQKIEIVSRDLTDIKAQLPAITQLQYQMTDTSKLAAQNSAKIDANNKETNARIDRVAESFGDKLDLISTNVNKIATAVEVLASQINERPRKTAMEQH